MLHAPNQRAEESFANRILGAADMLSAIIFNQMGRQQNLPRGCSPPAQENTRAAKTIADGQLGVHTSRDDHENAIDPSLSP